MRRTRHPLTGLIAGLAVLGGSLPGLRAEPRQLGLPALGRDDFNRLAVQQGSPLYWLQDTNDNGLLEPDELAASGQGRPLAPFVRQGRFTPRFEKEYRALVELRRQEAVRRELAAGRGSMIRSDLSGLSAKDKAVLKELLAAAAAIEELYLHQTGAFPLRATTRRLDPASQSLFWRNHGPWCVSAEVGKDPFCNALPTFPPRRSDAYPTARLQDEAMCSRLASLPEAKALLDPFTVVRDKPDGLVLRLVAVSLNQAYGPGMRAVAGRLRAAARHVADDPKEKALHRYLMEAARGFQTNTWEEADEAWAAMSSDNSRWYLRVAPDEVYFDPCQQKAGFHLSLGLIDQTSLSWKRKLTPLRKEMEQALARVIGKPYAAREVRFSMPDFVNLVLNAGDSRHPLGAIIGQSLPNWGRVAREGRGRTVVMANLHTDPDSRRIFGLKARALLSPATMKHYTFSPEPFLLNIILHEATHNFGPHSDYAVRGKTPKEIFGGKLASTLEELKAQNGGLWYLKLLRDRGLLDDRFLRQAYIYAIAWAFGHISQGMFTPTGNVRPYSQLAAVQVGSFVEEGALTFDKGLFTIQQQRLPAAVEKLMIKVGQIKARGDRAEGERLIKHYVEGKGSKLVRERHIRKKLARFPKGTLLYSVEY